MSTDEKIAVIFPGVGYTCDKPLLYYSDRLARQCGYRVVTVPYKNLPRNIKGDSTKMYMCFVSAREQAEDILAEIDWDAYSDIVFFSKSVGTAVALSYAVDHSLKVKNVLYTPLAETFKFPAGESIAFMGTEDPWADAEEISRICAENEVPLYITPDANHSLECGTVRKDIKTIRKVMKTVSEFIAGE